MGLSKKEIQSGEYRLSQNSNMQLNCCGGARLPEQLLRNGLLVRAYYAEHSLMLSDVPYYRLKLICKQVQCLPKLQTGKISMHFVLIAVFIGFGSVSDFRLGHGLILFHNFEKIPPRGTPPPGGASIICQVARTR